MPMREGKRKRGRWGGDPGYLITSLFFILAQNFGHIDEGTSTTTYFLPHISRLYICTTKLKIKETMQKMKIPKNTLKFKHPKKQKQKRDHYYGMSRTLHLKLKDVNIAYKE
jgi:hypothetical protein